MKSNKKTKALAATALGAAMLLSPALGRAQENEKEMPPLKVKIQWPIRDGAMTSLEPPPGDEQPPRRFISWEKTVKGYPLQRFSDGSSIELRPDCTIETTCGGTRIETLSSGAAIVRWPNGGGIVRNPDGTGAEFRPDPKEPSKSGDLAPIPGTVEVLPSGTVRQTIKDQGVVLDREPGGRVRSRADLAKPQNKTMDQPVDKGVNVAPLNSWRGAKR